MAEIHYLISDASKKIDVESHVLRYWEEELELTIPRNEMGHRYYTDLHIRLFKQIKDLKAKGYQLKAIKNALDKMVEEQDVLLTDEILEEDVALILKEGGTDSEEGVEEADLTDIAKTTEVMISGEKMEQFQQIMNHIIGQALEVNNEKLSQDISTLVNDKVTKDLEYLIQVADERQEERFKRFDETVRAYQKENKGRAEAAASKVPFFKKKKFGRSGKKV